MDYAALQAELVIDPLGRGYAGMSNAIAALSLNTANRSVLQPLAPEELVLWAADAGRGENLYQAMIKTQNSVALRAACRALYIVVESFQVVDPRDSRWNVLLNALVTGAVISQADKDALVAAATKTVSRAAELGFGFVFAGDVQVARAYPG
jgi:hypothetical protein